MKPSERILEIAMELKKQMPFEGKHMTGPRALDLRVECITRYLDEEYQKMKMKRED